jgi:hypothetical protein
MMLIKTEEGTYKIDRYPHDTTKIIVVSRSREALLSMINSIELAGTAEDEDFDDLYIYSLMDDQLRLSYELVIDRSTLKLWFNFEIEHYQHLDGIFNV